MQQEPHNFPTKPFPRKPAKPILVPRVLMIIAALATRGSTAPVVVTDSSGVEIDPGFTYEHTNDTCTTTSGDDQYDRMLQKIEILTTEHTEAATGATIYFTTFGGVDQGGTGDCYYDSTSFLAAHDSAGDFLMADTASVNWHDNNYGFSEFSGLNFQKSADSQVLGVPNSCNAGEKSPEQVSSASQLTLLFGFSGGDIYFQSINDIPSSALPGIGRIYPYANSGECMSSIVVAKAASASVLYLGTQSSHTNATLLSYGDMGALGIYYCIKAINFALVDIPVDAVADQSSTSIAILPVTRGCPLDLTWSLTETTAVASTLTSLNANVNPLSLDSATNPTVVNFSNFPASPSIGNQYTFQVTAQYTNYASINAASYTITVTIIDPCTIATFLLGQVQPAVPPEWTSYTYTGLTSYQVDFASDQPNCDPTHACSSSPALPTGDICQFTKASVQMSYRVTSSQYVQWNFAGQNSDRATMTDVPPGTYSITLTSTIDALGTNFQDMTHTFSITFTDPCPSTSPTSQWASLTSPVLYGINDPATTDIASMTDTVSYSHGLQDGQSFCGSRTFTLLTSFPWATFDTAIGLLTVQSTDISLAGSTETVSVQISLTDYPSITETISLDFELVKSCNDAIMTPQALSQQTATYFTWDAPFSVNLPASTVLANLDTSQDCGIFEVSLFSDAAGTVPIDSSIFTLVTETQIEIYTEDPLKATTYADFYFTVHLVDYPSVVSALEDANLEIVIKDRCSVEGGLAFTSSPYLSQPGPYYFPGTTVSIDTPSNLVTNLPTKCPILTYVCSVQKPDLTTMVCDQDDSLGTVSTFDSTTGVFAFQSSNALNTIYEQDSLYTVIITAYADLAQAISATATLELDLPCMVATEEFVWTIPYEEETEFVIRNYLTAPVYAPFEVAPFSTPPFFDDSACTLDSPVEYFTNYLSTFLGASGGPTVSGSLDPNDATFDLTPQPIGTTDTMTFAIDFTNLFQTSGLPSVERIVHYVDGHQYLELDFYTQLTTVPIDLSPTFAQVTLTPPRFKETAAIGVETGLELLDPQDPLREVTFLISGLTSEESAKAVEFTPIDNTVAGQVTIQFDKKDTNLLDTFDVVICYSYGDWARLTNLCDETILHPVTDALGLCFIEFSIQLEPIIVSSLESEAIVQTIGNESSSIVDLAQIASISYDSPNLQCGDLTYMLADSDQASFITVDATGLITLKLVTDKDLIGIHTVQFKAYLKESDPEATVKKLVPLTLTISIKDVTNFDTAYIEAIQNSLTKGPPVSTDQIASLYEVYFERKTQYFSFSFADQLALSGEADENKLGGLQIRVTNNTVAGVVKISQLQYPQVGYGTLVLEAYGVRAKELLAAGESIVGESTKIVGDDEAAEEDAVIGVVTIEVTDLSQGGLTATFDVAFQFLEESQNEFEIAKANQLAREAEESLFNLLREALDLKLETSQEEEQPLEVEVTLREISMWGYAYLDFSPSIVAVPNDWDQLWSLEEREKMSLKKRETFEEELKNIMHVEFIHNTDEEPQRYLMSNLTTFTNYGISIHLNFSDPILVSQGYNADKLRVKLLKSYFLVADPLLSEGYTRSLTTSPYRLIEDDEYIVFEHEIPRQLRDSAETSILEQTAEVAAAVLKSSFTLSFILNLILNGVMSELWSIFNTLQIIMALNLLAVILPANVIFVQEIVISVINFQIVDKRTLSATLIEPIFGIPKLSTSTKQNSQFIDYSLLQQLLELFLGIIIVGLVIALLYLCKVKVLPRCCSCIQKLVNFVMAKLIFNSLLRALMQTYLQTCLSSLFSLQQTNLATSEGQVDFGLALVTIPASIGFIFFAYKFLHRKKDVLREPIFKAKYDSLYQNLEYYKETALANTSFFLLRRLIFAAVIVFGGSSLVLQVVLADVLSTLLLIYFITQRPMVDTWINAVHILNELVVLVCVWSMFLFSNYVPNADTRYDLAYLVLYLIAADIVLNVLFLVFTIVRKIYQACRKYFIRRQAKKDRAINVQPDQKTTKEQVSSAPPVNATQKFLMQSSSGFNDFRENVQQNSPAISSSSSSSYLDDSSISIQGSQLPAGLRSNEPNQNRNIPINIKAGVNRPSLMPNEEFKGGQSRVEQSSVSVESEFKKEDFYISDEMLGLPKIELKNGVGTHSSPPKLELKIDNDGKAKDLNQDFYDLYDLQDGSQSSKDESSGNRPLSQYPSRIDMSLGITELLRECKSSNAEQEVDMVFDDQFRQPSKAMEKAGHITSSDTFAV